MKTIKFYDGVDCKTRRLPVDEIVFYAKAASDSYTGFNDFVQYHQLSKHDTKVLRKAFIKGGIPWQDKAISLDEIIDKLESGLEGPDLFEDVQRLLDRLYEVKNIKRVVTK